MLEGIRELSNLAGATPFWGDLVLVSIVLLVAVKAMFPWQAEWKSKTTKDKDGNSETKYYRLK